MDCDADGGEDAARVVDARVRLCAAHARELPRGHAEHGAERERDEEGAECARMRRPQGGDAADARDRARGQRERERGDRRQPHDDRRRGESDDETRDPDHRPANGQADARDARHLEGGCADERDEERDDDERQSGRRHLGDLDGALEGDPAHAR